MPVSWRSVPTPSPQLTDHLRQLSLRLPALALEAPDLVLHPAELLLDGLDDALHLLGTTRHLTGGSLLLRPAGLGHTLRERLARLRQHVDRDRRQLLARALAAVPRQRSETRRAEQQAEDSDDRQ